MLFKLGSAFTAALAGVATLATVAGTVLLVGKKPSPASLAIEKSPAPNEQAPSRDSKEMPLRASPALLTHDSAPQFSHAQPSHRDAPVMDVEPANDVQVIGSVGQELYPRSSGVHASILDAIADATPFPMHTLPTTEATAQAPSSATDSAPAQSSSSIPFTYAIPVKKTEDSDGAKSVETSGLEPGSTEGDYSSPFPAAPSSMDDNSIISIYGSPTFTWTSPASGGNGIAGYQVAIGTSAGGSDVVPWTSVGSMLSLPGGFATLFLTDNATYFGSVRTVDAFGNTSAATSGDGFIAKTSTCSAGPRVYDAAGMHAIAVPTSCTFVVVRAWGAGGGGGGAGLAGHAGGAGGAGAFSSGTLNVSPGQTLAVTVGTGGASGAACPTTNLSGGGGGGASSVKLNGVAQIVAAGGGGGGSGLPCQTTGGGLNWGASGEGSNYSIAAGATHNLVAGSGATPPRTADPFYSGSAGAGGAGGTGGSNGAPGSAGRVVLIWGP